MTAETSNAREPDVAMALHWIDRYAAGIDDECQIDLVADALGVTLPDDCAPEPSQQPGPKPEARGVVDEDALRDARTIYDIACIRESRDNATREDVEFKAICLRNYNRIAALTEARNVR